MPTIEFTSHLNQHIHCDTENVEASTLGEALEIVFERNPPARGYILDDQGSIRKHIAVFVDNGLVHNRDDLSVPLIESSKVYVMQALSGG